MRNTAYELSFSPVPPSPDSASALTAENPASADGNHTYRAKFLNGAFRLDTPQMRKIEPGTDVQWLWPGRIPLGKVTLIEGDEGSGKSFVALDLASRVSRGMAWPEGTPGADPGTPENPEILMIGRPDEFNSHGRRLSDMNADLSRFRWWREFDTFEPEQNRHGERPIEFPCDLPALEHELIARKTISVVVIDSLADVCYRPQDVAETLRRLNRLAAQRSVAILVTLPARCRIDGQGALRVTSRWKTDGARCVWCVVADPDDPRRKLFIPRRVNFCEEPPGLEFRFALGQVAWNPKSRIDPSDPLDQWKTLEQCLNRILQDGCVPATDVFRQGSQCGFNPKQLRSAARRLGIESHKSTGFGSDGCWQWYTEMQRKLFVKNVFADQARMNDDDRPPEVIEAWATAQAELVDKFPGSQVSASEARSMTYDPTTASRRPVARRFSLEEAEQDSPDDGQPFVAAVPTQSVGTRPRPATAKNAESLVMSQSCIAGRKM
ncbi:MAG: AAA family ATPase, partial [Planctomycetia bacterium]|nr:AAA family ATPase [Planctomycetia bacterium]